MVCALLHDISAAMRARFAYHPYWERTAKFCELYNSPAFDCASSSPCSRARWLLRNGPCTVPTVSHRSLEDLDK
jgi:hypothetical protein